MNESSWSVLGNGLANLNKALPPLPSPTFLKSKLGGGSGLSVRSATSLRSKQLRRSVSAGFSSANKLTVPKPDFQPCKEPRSPRPFEIGPDPFAAPQEIERQNSMKSNGSGSRSYTLPVIDHRNSLSADSAYSYIGPSDCSSRDSMEILHEDYELGTARSIMLHSSPTSCAEGPSSISAAPPPIVISRPPRSLLRQQRAHMRSTSSLQSSYGRDHRAEARYSCSSFYSLVERTFKTTEEGVGHEHDEQQQQQQQQQRRRHDGEMLSTAESGDTTLMPAKGAKTVDPKEEVPSSPSPPPPSSGGGQATVAIRIPLPPTPPPVVNTLAAASLRQLSDVWEKARSASVTEHLNKRNSGCSSSISSGGTCAGGGGGSRRKSTDGHHRYETVSERLEARKRELRLKRERAWASAKTDAFCCCSEEEVDGVSREPVGSLLASLSKAPAARGEAHAPLRAADLAWQVAGP
ncbi:hypothetical protein OC861_003572 [Tilletia horrida]|nr:hypothetical protein OC861_003572 [Tilletia horrida]